MRFKSVVQDVNSAYALKHQHESPPTVEHIISCINNCATEGLIEFRKWVVQSKRYELSQPNYDDSLYYLFLTEKGRNVLNSLWTDEMVKLWNRR